MHDYLPTPTPEPVPTPAGPTVRPSLVAEPCEAGGTLLFWCNAPPKWVVSVAVPPLLWLVIFCVGLFKFLWARRRRLPKQADSTAPDVNTFPIPVKQ
eukprot:gene3092-3637_t